MSNLPTMPEKPQRGSSASPRQSSWSAVMAVLGVGSAVTATLFFVLYAIAPYFAVAVFLVLGFIVGGVLLHYFLWGRTLGEVIRQEVAAEEASAAANAPREPDPEPPHEPWLQREEELP